MRILRKFTTGNNFKYHYRTISDMMYYYKLMIVVTERNQLSNKEVNLLS